MFSYNSTQIIETSEDLIDQVVSVEAYYITDNGAEEITLINLMNNVTIVFEGLDLNTTSTYE